MLTFNTLLAAIIALGIAAFFARSLFAPAHPPATAIETGVGRLPCESDGVCEPHLAYQLPSTPKSWDTTVSVPNHFENLHSMSLATAWNAFHVRYDILLP